MTVREIYMEAIIGKHRSLILLIDLLVKEKNVLQMNEPAERINYFLQDKWSDYINKHLQEYARRRPDLFGGEHNEYHYEIAK